MKHLNFLLIVSLVFATAFNASATESITTRTEIVVTVPDYDHLPLLDQFFYIDAERSQENPIWSPDGKTIAFNGRAGMGIWTVPVEGGTATLIHSNYHEFEVDGTRRAAYGSLTPLAFSPDGSEIYFHDWSLNAEGYKDLGNGSTANENPQIKVVNIATGEVRTVIKKAGFGCFTSDGRICIYMKYISYPTYAGIYAHDLETGEEWYIASGSGAALSADETEVIYINNNNGERQLKKAPLEGGESKFITDFDEEDAVYGPGWAQCSPDGKMLLFTARYNGIIDTSGFYSSGNVDYLGLCLMNLETGAVARITPDTQYLTEGCPKFSPDGTKFIYGGGTYTSYMGSLQTMIIQDLTQESIYASTAVETSTPDAFALKGNYPNPFNPSTTIEFSLAGSGETHLSVYSISGQLVRELVNGTMSAGTHSVLWNGLDMNGNGVSSGVYIYKLSSGSLTDVRRMTLLK